MGRLVLIVLVVLLSCAVIGLLLRQYSSLGIAGGYKESPPVDLAAFEGIVDFQQQVFEGYVVNGGGGGSATDFRQETAFQKKFAYTYSPEDESAGRAGATDKLLGVIRSLEKKAAEKGFALTEEGFECFSYGGEGAGGPAVVWPYTIRSTKGGTRSSSSVMLSGDNRFAYVSLTYVSMANLAATFTWTIILDRKTGVFQLITRYSALGPVYAGPDTPQAFYRLEI